MINVVELVEQGKYHFEWVEVLSTYQNYKLYIKVFRDAMKFDNIPALTWDFKPAYVYKNGKTVKDDRIFNGVRLPASAHQLQEIAYLLDCLFLTPKVIDLIWLQAQLKFNAVININGKIVAISNINDYHALLEKEISKLGGDDGTKLIECVGKYWCLMNHLYNLKVQGDYAACNYGWFTNTAPHPGVTTGTKVWQTAQYAHNKLHRDPSQVIRLMNRYARLVYPDGHEETVDLCKLMLDPVLSFLVHHEGVLTYQHQQDVPFRNPIKIDKPIEEPIEEIPIEPEIIIPPQPEEPIAIPVQEPEEKQEEKPEEKPVEIPAPIKQTSKTIWQMILEFLSGWR